MAFIVEILWLVTMLDGYNILLGYFLQLLLLLFDLVIIQYEGLWVIV